MNSKLLQNKDINNNTNNMQKNENKHNIPDYGSMKVTK